MEDGVYLAAVLPSRMLDGVLPDVASIFTAEMYAIKTVIEKSVASNGESCNYTIFLDSQSVLLALKYITLNCAIVTEIPTVHMYIYDLCLAPRRTGVVGNENADASAKIGSSLLINSNVHSCREERHIY